jgi:hypothetical protein
MTPTKDAAVPTLAEPVAELPAIPKSYGLEATEKDLLPWSWANERLERAKNFWVVTVRPDGRPHAVPVWGAFVEQRFYFDGGGRKATNLRSNPHVAVHLESGDEVVSLEGIYDKTSVPDPALFQRIRASYRARYEYQPETPEQLYVIKPTFVLGWSNFIKDATRWRFDR